MKMKNIVVLAVLTMFLASSVCVSLSSANGDDSSELRAVNAYPLYINGDKVVTGPEYGTLEDYNATYDATNHVLTLNGGVDINCICKDDKAHKCLIHIEGLKYFTIELKGKTIIRSTSTGTFGDDAPVGIFATAVSSLNITGDGSLTISPAITTNTTYVRGIWAVNVFIDSCTLNFDFSNSGYKNTCGIWANNKIYAYNTTINVTGNNTTTTGVEAHGLIAGATIEMQHTVYTAEKVMVGIGPTFNKDKKTENKIYCTLYDCSIVINGVDNAANALIKCMSLTIDYTEITAKSGKYSGTTSNEEPAYNFCIRTDMINVSQSVIDLKGSDGNNAISRLIFFESAFLIKYSTLTCEGYGCSISETQNHYSAIHGNGDNSAMSSECSSITVKFAGKRATDAFGIDSNCVFYHSDVKVECTTCKAYNPGKNVFMDESIKSLQGTKTDGGSYVDITADEIKDCFKVRVISERLAYFDLNGGEGTPVASIDKLSDGDTIVLPSCNAKRGDLVFVGWDDGNHVYKPGDTYVIDGSAYFTAVYADGTSSLEKHAAVIAVGVCIAIAALAVAIVNKKH